jgi:hypothetical protein
MVREGKTNNLAGIITSRHCVELLANVLHDETMDLDKQIQVTGGEPESAANAGRPSHQTHLLLQHSSVTDFMTAASDMVWVEQGTSITTCMTLMKEHNVRHLPVLTGAPSAGGSIKGVLSMGDILFAVTNGYLCPQCWAIEDGQESIRAASARKW